MSSLLEMVTIAWAVVAIAYFALFLYRSLVGMREEDTLYLSAGESRMADEQREIMKRITKLDSISHKIGWVALAMTLLVGGIWGYDALGHLL